MNDDDIFARWAALARGEDAPRTDAAPGVLARIRTAPAEEPGLWTFASASACAAAVVGVFGWQAWNALLGDWYGWLQDFSQWRPL
ncbi:MAG: hypothetical protein A2X36_15445 [Elusimicrobia bacterium GWA2_69_24]|nr:MAG: hypothetical protein A2X36_15445 [Elusimicrobia bacterium GWA2_69_24]HBL18110.1 hypothetical protein [Elusimicrobiota bacterium]